MIRAIFIIACFTLVGLSQVEAQQKRAAPQPPKAKFSKTALLGIWWSPEMPEVAAFVVNDTTFYYPDHFVERQYRIKGDTLFIQFEEGFVAPSIILKLTADTLVLLSWDQERVFTRKEPEEAPKRE